MTHRTGRMLALALLLCLAAVGPARAQEQPAAPASDLGAALALAPAGMGTILFTDWSLLKQYTGMTGLTSKSSKAARLRFMQAVVRDQAVASAYGLDFFTYEADTWSWDSTDLTWEENFNSPGAPPVYVLKFRADFDFAPVIAHFVQRGFTRSSYDGVPVYAHALDLAATWLQTTDLAILNTAVLADQKMLVLSPSPRGVHAVLDAAGKRAPAAGADRFMSAAATALGAVATAVLMPGATACRAFDPAHTLGIHRTPAQVKALLRRLFLGQTVHPYAAFGLGYRDEGGHPVGVIVLHYTAAAAARADLAPRRVLLAQGTSILVEQPYHTLVTLESATVSGADLLLRLRLNAGRSPAILFSMVESDDLLFAACSATA